MARKPTGAKPGPKPRRKATETSAAVEAGGRRKVHVERKNTRRRVDWAAAEHDYVYGVDRDGKPYKPSAMDIAEMYECSRPAVQRKARAESWDKKRVDHEQEVYRKTRESLPESIAQATVKHYRNWEAINLSIEMRICDESGELDPDKIARLKDSDITFIAARTRELQEGQRTCHGLANSITSVHASGEVGHRHTLDADPDRYPRDGAFALALRGALGAVNAHPHRAAPLLPEGEG